MKASNKINKSELFKNAWRGVRCANYDCFSDALKAEWRKLKPQQLQSSLTHTDVYSSILTMSEGFGYEMRCNSVWSLIMEEADMKKHFASDIIERALEGKQISTKQAWAVAYFAKNNNILAA